MIYDLIVPQFGKMLRNLSAQIDIAVEYAASKKFEPDVLWNARLAPDQFNFIRQVQIACDNAKFAAARLTGKDAPAHEDNEKSTADLKARIDKVLAYLSTFSEKDFADAATRQVSQPRWEGKYLTGQEFACQYAVPNFYFHINTAYAILRHNGVPVGKRNYLGELPFKK